MSILVDRVRIFGFRGIANLEISLPKTAVLIGKNNSGKTSVIKSLQLALGDYARYLSDEDFHIGKDDKAAEEILVDIRIVSVNDKGERVKVFESEWLEEFSDSVQAEADGHQFLAIRTKCMHDLVKGGFAITRFILDAWPNFDVWHTTKVNGKKQLNKRFEAIPFFSIEAQRDIHHELKDKASFVGKVLSGVKYEDQDIEKIEQMIATVNSEAVSKSEQLKGLKKQLEKLNHSFQGSGKAEITPFPKKIRDLSKRFTVHFGENEKNTFSMEYHGMGTRSWASMLTVKALTETLAESHAADAKSFYPVIAAEEPEAHLHPNAQRTLYKQLRESKGQIIISTHSPYLAALADQNEIISLSLAAGRVEARMLRSDLEPEEKRRLQREVIHSRGELLFSKAIILSEGETEEQALPQMFSKYFNEDAFSLGINFIGVGGSGARYRPYFSFAKDFNIPVFVFSDGEEEILKKLKTNYEFFFGATDLNKSNRITALDGTDFEGYLINSGFEAYVEQAIKQADGDQAIEDWIKKRQGTAMKPQKMSGPPCITCKQPHIKVEYRDYNTADGRKKAMLEILDSQKPKYGPAVAEELCKLEAQKFPPKVKEFFEKIKGELSL